VKILRAVLWAGMLTLIACFPLWAAWMAAEPAKPVQEKFESWSGVLRIWRCEGWQSGSGSLTGWLNACIESFEKKHKGVYVQVIDVDGETMRSYSADTPNPPDLLIWGTGMLDTPQDLVCLTGEYPLLETLREVGMRGENRYAVPVALGGYALAVNSDLIARNDAEREKLKATLFDMPEDTSVHSWSAAVMAMFAGSLTDSAGGGTPVGEGIDLGLTAGEEKEREPIAQTTSRPDALPVPLPPDFADRSSVYADFSGGHLAMMPITQREIRRLELLSDSGKAPEWHVQARGLPFTDQMALVSVTAAREEAERWALCMELIEWLLREDMQKKLTSSRAFSVCDMTPLYSSNRAMSAVESALKSENLLVPPAFGNGWRAEASALMNGIGAGESTHEAYEVLRQALTKK